MSGNLLALLLINGHLSLLAIGGVNSVLPEMQRQVVGQYGWMTAHEFASLYALAQAAPGPNMMVTTLIGWRVAGIAGALVATLATVGPPALLTFWFSRVWHRHRNAAWRPVVQAGLSAVTAGLILAAAFLLARATSLSWALAAITVACTVLFVRTRLNPLWLLLGCAALGALGVV